MTNKEEILKTNLEARENEVMMYQINIDNYTLALEEIENLSSDEQDELADFKQQLANVLTTEKLEQKKAKIMLSVLKKQLRA